MAEKAQGFWSDLLLEEFVESLEWARSPMPLIIPPPEQLADMAAGMVPPSLRRHGRAHLTPPVLPYP
ncbi:hypothetical protein [Nitrospirillum iridis]|uniref:Uncharacterized protein n=1 Tax=Nitrospirillum iridis TaxID=765888 RepID=A0A7X0AX23_9PROT|nr:hypothetical protein [Nitrospirillum iridis]MBB6251704.1 hypothetical protein [Nitrospirillum iridis]